MIRLRHASFDGHEALAVVEVDGARHEVFLRVSREILGPRAWGDVWAPFAMFAGMRLGENPRLNVPLSRARRANLKGAQRVLVSRFPQDFTPVTLKARHMWTMPWRRNTPVPPRMPVAQFFTGGVDSLYTMLTNPQVQMLVYAYDLLNEPPRVTELLRPHLREIASHYDKELIEIEYNARLALDPYADWGQQSYPGVLSSFAALLSGDIGEMLVPSQYAGTATEFWGDHPDINDWWAPGDVAYRYDAGDVARFEKTAMIATDQFARDHVRVCWLATDRLNCGVCEKCIRTRTAFEIVEKGFSSRAFPERLSLADLAELRFPHVFVKEIWADNLDAAKAAGRDDVARAIEQAFANSAS